MRKTLFKKQSLLPCGLITMALVVLLFLAVRIIIGKLSATGDIGFVEHSEIKR